MRLVGFISVWKRAGLEKGKGGVGESAKGRRKGYIVILLLRLLIRLLNRFYDVFSAAENLRSAVNFSLSISRPHFPFSCSPHPRENLGHYSTVCVKLSSVWVISQIYATFWREKKNKKRKEGSGGAGWGFRSLLSFVPIIL